MAKKNKKEAKRKRYFGLTVIREGKKVVWRSVQNKHGWSLGIMLNGRTEWLRNVRFQSRKDVDAARGSARAVFIHLRHAPKK